VAAWFTPASQRFVAGVAGSVSWQPVGQDGAPADPGTVTVTVARADGTALATDAATVGSGTGARSFVLTVAQIATLDRLTVTWKVAGTTVATTSAQVVGGHYFTNAEALQQEEALARLQTDPAAMHRLRGEVEQFLEDCTRQSWVPAYDYDILPASAHTGLVLPHPVLRRVRSVDFLNSDGTVASSLTVGECASVPRHDGGVAYRQAGWCGGTHVRIGYEHGHDAPRPSLKRAAITLTRMVYARPKGSVVPSNATNFVSEMGWSAVLITPGVRGAHTSDPDVNKAIDDHTFDEPQLAFA
jgi:hypothetical protein